MDKIRAYLFNAAETSKIETMLVFMVISLLIFTSMITTPFYVDESYWIATSDFLEDWVAFKTDSLGWEYNYGSISNPALPKYITAIGRITGEYILDIDNLYNIEMSYEENVAAGLVPTTELLYLSRVPASILSVLMCCALYIICTEEINRFFAITFISLIIKNATLTRLMVRAMSETPLLVFSLLSIFFFYRGYRSVSAEKDFHSIYVRQSFYRNLTLSGIMLGLAAACKIHAPLIMASYFLLIFYLLFFHLKSLNRKTQVSILIRSYAVILYPALFSFTFVHPLAYSNPFKTIAYMLKFRIVDMGLQVEALPGFSNQTILQRCIKIVSELLNDWATIQLIPFNILTGITGLLVYGIEGLRYLQQKRNISLFLLMPFSFLPLIASALMSPLNYPRYFLIPIFTVVFISSRGFTGIVEWLLMNLQRLQLHITLSLKEQQA